jgi:tryptophanase
VQDIFGYTHVIPTHQGRAAERILFNVMCKKGDVVPNNTHFDTTRANVEFVGAEAVDLLIPKARQPREHPPFKGNMDVAALEALIAASARAHSPGHAHRHQQLRRRPARLHGKRARRLRCLPPHNIPLYFDACRFAENAWFIKLREPGYATKRPSRLPRRCSRLGDGCTMSAKKDGMANIGGFLCTNDDILARQEKDLLILTEGYPTYGGLAGRDLEAIAVGLQESLDEDYLRYRIASTAYLGNHIAEQGVPIVQPPGGHAIYLDARAFLPHIPSSSFPASPWPPSSISKAASAPSKSAASCSPQRPKWSWSASPSRAASTPRATSTTLSRSSSKSGPPRDIKGLKLTYEAPFLRHFTAHLGPPHPRRHP